MTKKAITLLSGGLDSTVATMIARQNHDIVLAITFDYGQRAAAREIGTAAALCSIAGIKQRVIELPWLAEITTTALVNRGAKLPHILPETIESSAREGAASVWVPNRNGVFIAVTAAIAESMGCSAIVAGFNAEEAKTFSDNSAAFVDAANSSLKLSTRNGVSLFCPLIRMAKDDIAIRFAALNIAPEMFWCCYEGGDKLCGECESCARSIRAFKNAGAWDLIQRRFKAV